MQEKVEKVSAKDSIVAGFIEERKQSASKLRDRVRVKKQIEV